MRRHAQDYWLRVQADDAIAMLEDPFFSVVVKSVDDCSPEALKTKYVHELRRSRDGALDRAAMALLEAEMFHRELVSRGFSK